MMTEEDNKILAFLNDKMGGNVLQFDYADVIARVDQLDLEEKARLLSVCAAALSDKQAMKDETFRVSIVRIMVALLPLSLGMIADLLNKFSRKHDYEIHFTLFCYLDWTQRMPDAFSLTQSVLPLVEKYLLHVPRETARAVWMAGDMMGDHWNEQEAIPLLTKTAQSARYAVGRRGSLLGLEITLERLPAKSDIHRELLKTVRTISRSDRSKQVRKEAWEVVRDWRKRSRGAKAGFAKHLFKGVDMNALLETSTEDVFEGYL